MAEVYGILDYRAVPVRTLATLVAGLRSGSRVKMAMSQLSPSYTFSDYLLARIADGIQFLCWAKTKDGQKNRNRPAAITEKMFVEGDKKKDAGKEIVEFDSPEEFERARKLALAKGRMEAGN